MRYTIKGIFIRTWIGIASTCSSVWSAAVTNAYSLFTRADASKPCPYDGWSGSIISGENAKLRFCSITNNEAYKMEFLQCKNWVYWCMVWPSKRPFIYRCIALYTRFYCFYCIASGTSFPGTFRNYEWNKSRTGKHGASTWFYGKPF